jgi:hypothetical protein
VGLLVAILSCTHVGVSVVAILLHVVIRILSIYFLAPVMFMVRHCQNSINFPFASKN